MFVRTAVLATNLGVRVKIGRERAGVGDLAGPWRTGGRRRGGRERLPRPAPVGQPDRDERRRQWWRRRWSTEGEKPADAIGFFVTAPMPAMTWPSCSAAGRRGIEPGVRAPVASAARGRAAMPTRCSTARCCARRRDRFDEALRAQRDAAGLANSRTPGAARSRHRRARGSGGDRAAAGLERHAQRGVEAGTSRPRPSWAATACCCRRRTTTNVCSGVGTAATSASRSSAFPLVDARVSGPKEIPIAPAALDLAVQLNFMSGGAMGNRRSRPARYCGRARRAWPASTSSASSRRAAQRRRARRRRCAAQRRQAGGRQARADDRQGRCRHRRAQEPAEDRTRQRAARRGDVQRSQRRAADHATTLKLWPAAVVPGIRPPPGPVRAANWPSPRSRSTPPANRSRARRWVRAALAGDQHAQAPRRQLLRLRQPHRGEGAGHAVQRQQRRSRPAACEANSTRQARWN